MMERVRRETRLARDFETAAIAAALRRFRELYGVPPLRAVCAPNVLARYCDLTGIARDAHAHSLRLDVGGVPLAAGVLARDTIVFEGEVDEDRMGDW